jgi:hypothetical protein
VTVRVANVDLTATIFLIARTANNFGAARPEFFRKSIDVIDVKYAAQY